MLKSVSFFLIDFDEFLFGWNEVKHEFSSNALSNISRLKKSQIQTIYIYKNYIILLHYYMQISNVLLYPSMIFVKLNGI